MKELDESTFNQIHAYLRGEGTPQERAAFEAQMEADALLAQEVRDQQRIQKGVRILANRKRISAIHSELKASGQLDENGSKESVILPLSSTNSRWKVWAAAASLIFVAGAAWFVYVRPTHMTTSGSVAEQTERKEGINDTTFSQVPIDKPELALETKKESKVADKIPLRRIFEQNFDRNPSLSSPFSSEKMGMNPGLLQLWEAETADFFKGVDLLEKGEASAALTLFEKTSQSRFDELRVYGEWYAALALLRLSEESQAIEKLKKIIQTDGHLYQLRAQKLLKQVQSAIQ